LSEVLQGSVLGPLLFVVVINDIDGAVRQVDIIRKFADDTKIGQKMVTVKDKERLQVALEALNAWASA
jgi:ribonuclease P/MRP protein subunit RPP40